MKFRLPTGAEIPAVAYGTFGATGEDSYNATLAALRAGYRHIDTAFRYNNEVEVGRAIRDSGIPRGELFVTSKMGHWHARDPEAALAGSLERLGLEYLDLYLVHWPFASFEDPENPWGFGKAVDHSLNSLQIWHKFQGLPRSAARALGVSNYTAAQLREVLESPLTRVRPAALQVELHPELPQRELVEYAQREGLVVEAYSPLAQGSIPAAIRAIAAARGADAGQVALSWNLGRKVVVLPRSRNPARIRSNLCPLELEPAELEAIAALDSNRRVVNPFYPGTQERIFASAPAPAHAPV